MLAKTVLILGQHLLDVLHEQCGVSGAVPGRGGGKVQELRAVGASVSRILHT
jgi:hypothetical protein